MARCGEEDMGRRVLYSTQGVLEALKRGRWESAGASQETGDPRESSSLSESLGLSLC